MNAYSDATRDEPSTQPIYRIDTPTVYLVDDDAEVQQSLKPLLESLRLPLRAFTTGEDFLKAYDGSPGCLITDLRMPSGLAGIELQTRLARSPISLPLIITARVADASLAVRAIHNRGVRLIEKPYRDHELIEAIQNSLRTDRLQRQQVAEMRLVLARLETLSKNEMDVLDLIVEGVTNKVVAKRLDVSVRTVENRRKRIYEKMRTESVAGLVRMVVEARIRSGQSELPL